MKWLLDVISFIGNEWRFFSWRDTVEILFFSTIAYKVLRWLSQDEQKNLLRPFYAYFTLTVLAYFLNLGGIFIALLLSLPVGAMLFILLHQKTLQKNYVTLKKLTPRIEATDKWLEELIQASLRGINKEKTVICIIEQQQSLSTFFNARCTFNAPITQELLDLLMSTDQGENSTITLWASHNGTLMAFNPTWIEPCDELWVADDLKLLHKRKQDALLVTQKSDALITILSPEVRLFDLIVKGKSFDNISAGYAFSLAKQIILSKSTRQGDIDASITHSRSFQQPHA